MKNMIASGLAGIGLAVFISGTFVPVEVVTGTDSVTIVGLRENRTPWGLVGIGMIWGGNVLLSKEEKQEKPNT